MELSRCPHCELMTFDIESGQCTNCHLRGSDGLPIFDRTALDGLLHNVTVFLGQMGDGSFQQLSGVFGPRPGRGPEDAIPFTESQCAIVYRHLQSHAVPCRWIIVSKGDRIEHSLLIAKNEYGLDCGVAAGHAAADQIGGRFQVKST